PSRNGQRTGAGHHRRRQSDRRPDARPTLCIAIAWFPLFDLSGVAGYLFKPMAEAVMIAMLASFIFSRTLVPTMAKYMMKSHHGQPHEHQQHGQPGTEPSRNVFVRFQQGFERRFNQ